MISLRTSNVPKQDVIFQDCFTVMQGGSRSVVSAPRRVVSAPRLVVDTPMHVTGTLRCFQVHLKFSPVLRGDFKLNTITSMGLLYQSSEILGYSNGRPECPPRVQYSPEIDASKFTFHTFSDTAGGVQWLRFILLMKVERCIVSYNKVYALPRNVSGPTQRYQVFGDSSTFCHSSPTGIQSYSLALFLCCSCWNYSSDIHALGLP